MTRARWLTLGMLAGMFALGGICGAGVMRAVDDREMTELMDAPPAEARRNFRLRAMARQLGLSPQQRVQAREILKKYRDECVPPDHEARERLQQCQQQAEQEIRQLLGPGQQRKLDRIKQNRGRRYRHRFRGGRP